MADIFNLSGRHALVTGASSGLGAGFAQMLADRGASVTLAARRLDRVEENVAAIRERGGNAFGVAVDVTDEASVGEAFAAARAHAGAVTIVINNAGIATTQSALDLETRDFDSVLDTNLRGAWLVARQAATDLRAGELPGCIVNIASILGVRVSGAVMPYAVSKAAIIQMTRALALEWSRYKIRVNALAPGYVETPLNRDFLTSSAGDAIRKRIPERRFGNLADLEGPLLLLCSDAGSYMTGSVLVVDGGHLVSSL
ncbi:MAG: 3-oxoacyl-ACP reductase [marine bacterium B5-7]|nr:MAG: 3-oxoacyl-ACP reductase [marine bacterium B5-7]